MDAGRIQSVAIGELRLSFEKEVFLVLHDEDYH